MIHSLKKLYQKRLNRNLNFDILTSFFVLQFITAISIIFYMHTNNTNTIVEFCNKMVENLSDSKVGEITHHFTSVQEGVGLATHLINGYDSVSIENTHLISYMTAFATRFPYVESIFMGLENGRFFQIKRLTEGATYRASPNKQLPKKSLFALRILDRDEAKAKENWFYLDSEGKIIEQEEIPEFQVTFDHKVREWYQKPSQTLSYNWSQIYVFSTTHQPGMAISFPLKNREGKPIGAIGSDIPLDSMSKILRDNSLKGLLMVLNKQGEILAHPTESNLAKISNGVDVQLVTVEDLKDKVAATGFKEYLKTTKSQFIFTYNKTDYIATLKPFDLNSVKDWYFCIIIPIDVFIGKVKSTQHVTFLICLGILSVSIFLIAFIAKRISDPINHLAIQADEITNLHLDEIAEVKSNIAEIQRLQHSMTVMRRSLISFNKFVPQNIVKRIIERKLDTKIGGKNRRVTMLFSDIQGFTTISEKYPPDKLMNHISEYFDEITGIMIKYHATIDKYIGDSIMAFWGAPHVDKDHILNACVAALHAQKRLGDLNRKWIFEKKPPLITRIGIHTGEVIVGNLGSQDRMNYTILGDNVNLASRLEGENKHYGTFTLISHEVVRYLSEQIVVRPVDNLVARGRTESIRVYELIGVKGNDPLLIPTQEQLEMCSLFSRGFHLYLEQLWNDALNIFESIQAQFGQDHLTQMYIARCKTFLDTPPPSDWDGVWR